MGAILHSLNWDLRDVLPVLGEGHRLNVLIALLLRSNLRARCYPSIDRLVLDTGKSVSVVTEAKKWLETHGAFTLVPHALRVDDETKLPIRQHVYQLTGVVAINGVTTQYLYLSPEETKQINSAVAMIKQYTYNREVSESKTSESKTSDSETKVYTDSKVNKEKDSVRHSTHDVLSSSLPNDGQPTIEELQSRNQQLELELAQAKAPKAKRERKPKDATASPKAPKARNPMFDAVATHIWKINGEIPEGSTAKLIGMAASEIRKVDIDAKPDDVIEFVKWCGNYVPQNAGKVGAAWLKWRGENQTGLFGNVKWK